MKKHTKNHVPFGLHLMLDAYNCPREILDNQNLVYEFLDEMPNLLKMKKLIKPYVVFAEGNDKKDPGGWSGFVIIQESHVSIHTFTKREFVTVDVYSCTQFDPQIAINYFKKQFRTEDIEYEVQIRGKKYPSENIN